jgi:protein associated with RNAse G/E
MSYFDFYFNTDGDKSLRSYSLPLDLSVYNDHQWSTTDEDLEYIGDKLEKMHHFPVINNKMIRNLKRASDIMLKAGMLGSKAEGLFKPK